MDMGIFHEEITIVINFPQKNRKAICHCFSGFLLLYLVIYNGDINGYNILVWISDILNIEFECHED